MVVVPCSNAAEDPRMMLAPTTSHHHFWPGAQGSERSWEPVSSLTGFLLRSLNVSYHTWDLWQTIWFPYYRSLKTKSLNKNPVYPEALQI